jgi:hypothetical protein
MRAGEMGYDCRGCGEWVPQICHAPMKAAAAKAAGAPRGSSRSQGVLDMILQGVVGLGGVATTVDLRPLAWEIEPAMTGQDITHHIMHLCDTVPPQLERPFGLADERGDTPRRRAWLIANRPSQVIHDTQVWRLTLSAKRSLIDAAASVGAPAASPAVASAFTSDLLDHATRVVPAATGYRQARLIQMLSQRGAVETVTSLSEAYRFEPSDGFSSLVSAGHAELTLEAFVLGDARSAQLFSELDLRTARHRLAAAGFQAPGTLGA